MAGYKFSEVKKLLTDMPAERLSLIEKAFKLCQEKIKDVQSRKMPSVPLTQLSFELLMNLAELKVDSITMAASQLFFLQRRKIIDCKELEKEFGEEVTKIAKLAVDYEDYQNQVTNEKDLRKLLLAMTTEPRMIFIELAKRAAYTKHIDKIEGSKREDYAKSNLNVYSAIAHKLGMNKIKSELEDLSFKALHPDIYDEIEKGLKHKEREQEIKKLMDSLEKELKKNKINAIVTGRPKRIYSIYWKMKTKNKSFEEVYDLTGLRVITETVKECYEALGVVHSMWKPLPGEFDDYIAKPKENMYQSLHTTLVGPNKKIFEVQIRTKEMNKNAEHGAAVHWMYKKRGSDRRHDKRLAWLNQMIEWRKDLNKTKEFLDSLKADIVDKTIFVFTPKKQVIELPEGSTALDFAYTVHTEIGHHCQKAKVNDKLVSIGQALNAGDTVEIITSQIQSPKRHWLNFVKTSKARSKIRSKLQIEQLQKRTVERMKQGEKREINLKDSGVRLARCCTPVPGDKVIGYITTKRKTIVHRADCLNINKEETKDNIIKMSWPGKIYGKFTAEIKVEGNYSNDLISNTLKILRAMNINVNNFEARKIEPTGLLKALVSVNVSDKKEIEKIMDNIRKVNGITIIERN